MKPDLEARFVALLRDAMAQQSAAEERADKRPSCETRQRGAAAGRLLWVPKGLTAFVPMAQRRRGGAAEDDEAEVDEMTTKFGKSSCWNRHVSSQTHRQVERAS